MGLLDGMLTRLNEGLVIDSSKCTRVRHKKSECVRCMEVCAAGAVSITRAGGKVLIDWRKCTSCGECLAVCPNGVFSMKQTDRKRILTSVNERINAADEAVFTCAKSPDETQAYVESLAYVSRELMIKAALRGAGRIVLVKADCEGCKHEGCMDIAVREIEACRDILRLADCSAKIVLTDETPETVKPDKKAQDDTVMSRRQFFTMLRENSKKSVGQTLYSLSENDGERQKTVLAAQGGSSTVFSDDLKRLGGDGFTELLRRENILPSVDIDRSKCRKCGVCARMCPSGVFTPVYEKVKGRDTVKSISIDKDLCTGCGLCAISCFSKAVSCQVADIL